MLPSNEIERHFTDFPPHLADPNLNTWYPKLFKSPKFVSPNLKPRASNLKPRLRVTCNAEDPFLIGRELISQGCDWPNENLVSIPVKQPKLFQVLLSFPSSIASRGVSRSNRVCEEVLRATRHHTGLFTNKKIRGEARKIRKFHF